MNGDEHSNPADQNVERLLRESYRPEPLPGGLFDRIEAAMLRAAGERATRASLARRSWWSRPALSAAMSVAAVLIVALAIWIAAHRPSSIRPQTPIGPRTDNIARAPLPATTGQIARNDTANTRPTPESSGPGMVARPIEPQSIRRVGAGETIATAAGQKRRVTLEDGSVLYVNQDSHVTIESRRSVAIDRGDVFIEVAPTEGERFTVKTPARNVIALGTRFAVNVNAKGTGVLVTQGKVQVSGVSDVVSAGSELTTAGAIVPAPRASAALDWIGELVAVEQSRLVPVSAYTGGAIVVKDPSGQESRLELRNFHVDVYIEDGFARTTIDQTYFNHHYGRLEGTFYFPLPADAGLSRLAMYVEGKLMEGGMAERETARAVFESIVAKQKDPALLEWIDGTTFKMRVFPLEGRQEKRIVLSYVQRLSPLYGKATYRFPQGHTLGTTARWSFHALVKGAAAMQWASPSHALQESRVDGNLALDAVVHSKQPDRGPSGARPNDENRIPIDRDVVLTFSGRGDPAAARFAAQEFENHHYLLLRWRPELPAEPQKQRRDWIFLHESSAARDPLVARAQIEIIRTILANAEHDDTFAVISANTHPASPNRQRQRATPENIAAATSFLDRRQLIGALNLGQAFDAAAAFAKDAPNPFLVHVGSGIDVMGPRDDERLLKRLPANMRYVGIGVGKRWSRQFMKFAAARTGGYFTQINPDENVAWRAFDLLATLNTPRLLDVKAIDPGEKVHFLSETDSLAQGEQFCAAARLEKGQPLPASVIVSGLLNGKTWKQELKVERVAPNAGYLARFWAKLEIDRLIAAGAQDNRAKIIELSKSMYVMSPFTSLLVLENDAMYAQYNIDRGRKDHWALYPCPDRIAVVTETPATGAVAATQSSTRPVQTAQEIQREKLRTAIAQCLGSILIRGTHWPIIMPGRDSAPPTADVYSLVSGAWAVPVVYWDGTDVNGNGLFFDWSGPRNIVPGFTPAPFLSDGTQSITLDEFRVMHAQYRLRGVEGIRLLIDGNVRYAGLDNEGRTMFLDGGFNYTGGVTTAVGPIILNGSGYLTPGGYYNGRLAARDFFTLNNPVWSGDSVWIPTYSWDNDFSYSYRNFKGHVVNEPVLTLQDGRYIVHVPDGGDIWLGRQLIRSGQDIVTRVYDVRDLDFTIPDFDQAPDFSLSFGSGRGGGSGGRGGGGLFGANTWIIQRELESRRHPLLTRHGWMSSRLPEMTMTHPSREIDRLVQNSWGDMYRAKTEALEKDRRRAEEGEIRIELARESFARRLTNNPNFPEKRKIPFEDLIRDPESWPDMAEMRAREIQFEKRLKEEEAAVQAHLDRRLPEINFTSQGLADVVEFLRDVTGSSFWVDWRSIEAAGLDKATPVTAHLKDARFAQAMDAILENAGDGKVKLAWTLGNGAFVITTAQRLNRAARGAWAPMAYHRPVCIDDNRLFTDLLIYAPGLNTGRADIAAAIERETPLAPAPPGTIDDAARNLIERARRSGWVQARIGGATIRINGAGQLAIERTGPEGLREIILSDGATLWHVYPELGIGARRPMSRFHRAQFIQAFPWLLPPVEDFIAASAKVIALSPDTIAIEPAKLPPPPATRPTTTPKTALNPEVATYLRIELRFENDRLVERSVLEMPARKLICRMTLAANGTVAIFDAQGREAGRRKIELSTCAAPGLVPDKNLVILPMPWRTRAHANKSLPQNYGECEKWSVDDKFASLAMETINGGNPHVLVNDAFGKSADRPLGLFTILLSHGVSLDAAQIGVPRQPADSAFAQYLLCASRLRAEDRSATWPAVENDGFVARMSMLAEIHSGLLSNTIQRGNQLTAAKLPHWVAALARCIDSDLAWSIALRLRERIGPTPALDAVLVDMAQAASRRPGLDYAGRYEAARALLDCSKAPEARKIFGELYRQAIDRGIVPAMDDDFYRAFRGSDESRNDLATLMRDCSKRLAERFGPVAAIEQAIQLRQRGQDEIAAGIFEQAYASLKDEDTPIVRLAAIRYLHDAQDLARAQRTLEPLFDDAAASRAPGLWRLAAHLADRRSNTALAARCLDRALEIELTMLPDNADLQHFVRGPHAELLAKYETVAAAMTTLGQEPSREMLARIIHIADRWRQLDPDATGPCNAAARVLGKLGAADLAWAYLTTPLAQSPNESKPWQNLATQLAQQGDVNLADHAYATAIEIDPANPQLLWDRAEYLSKHDRLHEARELYRKLAQGSWDIRFEDLRRQAAQRSAN